MPEGPQVRRTGNMIAEFSGVDIIAVEHPKSRTPWELELPVQISRIEVKGKNIFIWLSDGQVIYNHMLMWGRWRKGPNSDETKRINTLFHTAKGDLGYYGGGILRLISAEEAREKLALLGPDIMTAASAEEAFQKVSASPDPIGTAIMRQDLVSGIGNIYKSEGLFAARLHPLKPANDVTTGEYSRLFAFLQPQMVGDVKRIRIVTTTPAAAAAGNKYFVYRRTGRPCLLCQSKIQRIVQAPGERSTYFCPNCQKSRQMQSPPGTLRS